MCVCVFYYCIEWTHVMQNEIYSLSKLRNSDTGPEIILSMAIAKDFSWSIHYRHQIVDSNSCSLLKDMPSLANSGNNDVFISFAVHVSKYNHCSIQSNVPY